MFKCKLFVLVLYLLLSLPSGVLAQTAVYNVFAAIGANGTLDISTASPTLTTVGSTASFKFNADNGYHIASITGCGGSDYANINSTVTSYVYTTGPIQTQCTVSAAFSNSNSVIQLPQTGQTKCYDTAGAEITCAGTGQDGDKKMGVTWDEATRFSNNGNGTITDTLTGLIWLQNANCTDTSGGIAKVSGSLTWADALTWSNSLASGLCGLTDSSSAGQWRLPTRNELESLVNWGEANSTTWLGTKGFSAVQAYCWSSTTYAFNTDYAWSVVMHNGGVNYNYKSNFYYVWPVRGGQ